MANIGIISEFNPFHTGHKYLIENAKGENDTVICVMSGNFVQRGDTAILPKSERTAAALKNGADLVIELPVPYSMSYAERFAKSSVYLLKSLGIIDEICFGSEIGETGVLYEIADILSRDEFENKISERLKSGDTFAKIRTDILRGYDPHYAEIISEPNNILGIEYILAAKSLGFNIPFRTIKRIGARHDTGDTLVTASASHIRQMLFEGNKISIDKFLPYNYSGNFASINNLEKAVLANLRANNSPERYAALPEISEGLENRIFEAVKGSSSLPELYENIKTKRYTLARIRRIVLSAFLGINEDMASQNPPYIRVLGFTEKGKSALAEIAKKTKLPIICTAKDALALEGFAKEVFEKECTSSDIWALSLNYPQKCGNEYYYKLAKG